MPGFGECGCAWIPSGPVLKGVVCALSVDDRWSVGCYVLNIACVDAVEGFVNRRIRADVDREIALAPHFRVGVVGCECRRIRNVD